MALAMQLPTRLSGCTISRVGLQISSEANFNDWKQIGDELIRFHSGMLWWLGDWYNQGDGRWRGKLVEYSQLAKLDYGTLADATWICRKIAVSRRRENLSIAYHREVAHLEPLEQTKWLDMAEHHKLKRLRLRMSIRAERLLSEEECEQLAMKTGGALSVTALSLKFNLLLAHQPIEKWSLTELKQRHEELQPFIAADQLIVARLEELNVAR
jgi:hypothetical protein